MLAMRRTIIFDARWLSRAVGWASLATGLLLFLAPDFSAWLFGMGDHATLMRYLGARDIFIGTAILLTRRLAPWMLARAIADSADVAIVIGVFVTGTPDLVKATLGFFFAASFCCLDFYLSQRLRYEELATVQPTPSVNAARGVEVGRAGVRSAPE